MHCIIWDKSPVHTSDSRVVTVSNLRLYTLVRSHYKAAETVWQRFFLFCFVYMIQKSSEHNRRCSKIVEADVIRQKFQMQLELQIAIESGMMMSQS